MQFPSLAKKTVEVGIRMHFGTEIGERPQSCVICIFHPYQLFRPGGQALRSQAPELGLQVLVEALRLPVGLGVEL